jgi:hypothetical protein
MGRPDQTRAGALAAADPSLIGHWLTHSVTSSLRIPARVVLAPPYPTLRPQKRTSDVYGDVVDMSCQNVSVILVKRGGRSGSNPQARAACSIIR